MIGERVATLERVHIQVIHLSGYKLTDYQQYPSFHEGTAGWNRPGMSSVFGVRTVLLGMFFCFFLM